MTRETSPRSSFPRLLAVLAATLAVGLTGAGAGPARAEPLVDGVALSAGVFNVLNSYKAAEGGFELRLRPLSEGLAERPWVLRPAVGAMVTADETFYGYAGFRLELPIDERWTVVPQTAVGFYDQGDGKDLAGSLQFRTALEIAYKLNPANSVGAVFYHLSNAGFERSNPGSESLVFYFAWR